MSQKEILGDATVKPTPPEASTGFCFCVVSLRHKERETLRHQASGWITQLAHNLAPAPTPHCVYLEALVTRQGEASAEEGADPKDPGL